MRHVSVVYTVTECADTTCEHLHVLHRLMAVTKALTGLVGSRKIITTVVGTGQRVGVEFQKAYAEMQKLAGIAA